MLYQNALNEFQLIKAQKIYEAGACEDTYWNAEDADSVFAMSNDVAKDVWDTLLFNISDAMECGLNGGTCVPCISVGWACSTCFYAKDGHLVCPDNGSTWSSILKNSTEPLSLILSNEFYRNTTEHLQRKYGI